MFEQVNGGRAVSTEELMESLRSLSTLLWRIEIARSRIEFLNLQSLPTTGLDVAQLLKNRDNRRRFVHPEDSEALDRLMEGLRRGEGGTLLFRAEDLDGRYHWLKLSGERSARDARFMVGHLIDLSEDIEGLHRRDAAVPIPGVTSPAPTSERVLLQAMRGVRQIETVLRLLLENQTRSRFDAILFSDIHIRKNRVEVYSYGAPFTGLPQGKIYPYEGTIAESIVRFGLDSLVVDDTLDSIKAIDWALFVPAGIRSYFAKPFYHGSILRSVLILCATAPCHFSGATAASFESLYPPFLSGLKEWRHHSGSKRGKLSR